MVGAAGSLVRTGLWASIPCKREFTADSSGPIGSECVSSVAEPLMGRVISHHISYGDEQGITGEEQARRVSQARFLE
jgi:hypothetical protein